MTCIIAASHEYLKWEQSSRFCAGQGQQGIGGIDNTDDGTVRQARRQGAPMLHVVSVSLAMCRSEMPVRSITHSCVVSIPIAAKS